MTDPATEQQLPPEDSLPTEAQPVQPAIEIAREPAPATKRDRLRLAGVVLALLGVCLAAAPHASPRAAQVLARLVAPEIYGGLLITAGLGLFVGGLLRRALTGIRGSLAELQSETSRLDELSHDTRLLCGSFEQVQLANQDLKIGVADIHKRIERLTEIASDPEHTVSMFRLAASVDQLGARLDIFIKDQFKNMRQQLTDVVAHTQQSEQSLGARLAELVKQLDEQHAHSVQTGAGIGQKLGETREALGRTLESIIVERKQSAVAQKDALDELREHIELRLQEHTTYVAECLGQLDGAVTRSGREYDALAKDLVAGLEQRLADNLSGLQQSFGPVAEAARRGEQAGSSLLSLLAELETHVAAQNQALQLELKEGLERVQAVSLENGATSAEGLQAAARLESRLKEGLERVESFTLKNGATSVEGLQAAARLESRLKEGLERVQALAKENSATSAESLKVAARLESRVREGLERVQALAQENGATSVEGLKATARLESRLQESLERVQALAQENGAASVEGLKATARLESSLQESLERVQALAQDNGATSTEGLQAAARLESRLQEVLERVQAVSLENGGSSAEGLQAAARLESRLQEVLERVQAASQENGGTSTEGLQAAARLEARVQECEEALSRAFASTREEWSRSVEAWNAGFGLLGGALQQQLQEQLSAVGGQLERIDGALDLQGRVEAERNTQAAALAERLEHEIADNSTRLGRLADELAGLASLADEVRAAGVAQPDPHPRELGFGSMEPAEPLAAQAPSQGELEFREAPQSPDSIVAPALEPPPALPSGRDLSSDVTP